MPGQRGQAAPGAAAQATAPAGAGGADDIRQQQRRTWDHFAPGWAQWDALVTTMLAPVAAQMIGVLAPREGSEHLDIASGTGEPGLSVAALIPRGRVVLTDLSGQMLAAASANAATRGLSPLPDLSPGPALGRCPDPFGAGVLWHPAHSCADARTACGVQVSRRRGRLLLPGPGQGQFRPGYGCRLTCPSGLLPRILGCVACFGAGFAHGAAGGSI